MLRSDCSSQRDHADSLHDLAPAPLATQGAEHRQRRSRHRASQHPRIRGRYLSGSYAGDNWRPIFRIR